MKKFFFTAAIICAALTGCVHTNNLSKYEVGRATIFFEGVVEPGATTVEIHSAPPTEEESKKKKSAIEVFGDVASGIGTAIAANSVEEKLLHAADPNEIIQAVSDGVEKTLVNHYGIQPTRVMGDGPAFIVTSRLEEVEFNSTPNGMFLEVQATVTMTDRKTAEIVWENRESETVSLTRWYENILNGNSTLSNVKQTAQLASLSEEQLRSAIRAAAQEVGQEMAETLRDDIRKAEKEKITAKND